LCNFGWQFKLLQYSHYFQFTLSPRTSSRPAGINLASHNWKTRSCHKPCVFCDSLWLRTPLRTLIIHKRCFVCHFSTLTDLYSYKSRDRSNSVFCNHNLIHGLALRHGLSEKITNDMWHHILHFNFHEGCNSMSVHFKKVIKVDTSWIQWLSQSEFRHSVYSWFGQRAVEPDNSVENTKFEKNWAKQLLQNI
jgi:hypothetical protein